MSSLSLHTLSLSLSLSLSPHPTESTRPCTGATETTKEQFFPPFPILSRYLLYLSIGHSWNERRRDRAAHGFHPPNEKELRSSISPGSTGESSPDLSKGTSFSLSFSLSFPTFRCRFHRPRAPTIHALHNAYSLSKGPNNRPNKR